MSVIDEIYDYLVDARTMQLATVSEGKPWICTVYFVIFEGKIYWLSLPSRRHSQEIESDPNVAVAFAIKVDQPITGVQAEGSAEVVAAKNIVKSVMDVYVKKYGQGEGFYESFAEGSNQHSLYCFTPKSWVLFDENKYPKDPRRVVSPKT